MIDFDTLFQRLGNFFAIGEAVQTALRSTVPDAVDYSIQGLPADADSSYEEVREGVRRGLATLQGAGTSAIGTLVQTPVKNLATLTVRDDAPFASTLELVLAEWIRQMEAEGESLDASTPGASASYGSGNAGDGAVILSTKRADGRQAEFILAESIECLAAVTSTGATFTIRGEPLIPSLSPLWPGGSGVSKTVISRKANASDNLVPNGTFEAEDDYEDDLPEGWLAPVATLGTTLKLTPIEEQTVAISGTPTAGYYTLSWANADGNTLTTAPLSFEASASEVQAALRTLPGLEAVTVTSTGTSPNLTHTVVFVDVPSPAQLTSTSAITPGSIAHATTVAGSANVLRGARAVEFDADGAQLTTIMAEVALTPLTQYATWLFALVDVVPAAGVLTIDLVDGVGGTVINDEQAAPNSFTIDATALTTAWALQSGFFRTPATLPAATYLRIRMSTAVSNGTSLFVDEAVMVKADELYADGLAISIIEGPDEWEPNDRAVIAVTNDRAGRMHDWLARVFGLRESRLLFPTSGSETINDDLALSALLAEDGATLLSEDSETILLD